MSREDKFGVKVALLLLVIGSVAFGAGLAGAFDIEDDLGRPVPFIGVFEAY
ncbi:MAG: hypothetical protein SFW67_11050 [Myxococcaceae bacterium]|nr:hypothetical protein [Myxococcaceae bacterium]